MRVFTPSVDIPRTGLFELRVAVSWDKEIEILYKDRMEEIVNSAFNILLEENHRFIPYLTCSIELDDRKFFIDVWRIGGILKLRIAKKPFCPEDDWMTRDETPEELEWQKSRCN